MDFVEISNFFLSAFFTEIISENIFFDIYEQRKMILGGKNERFKKSQKMEISKGVSP